jgi:alpha-1,3-mannosyltransferase
MAPKNKRADKKSTLQTLVTKYLTIDFAKSLIFSPAQLSFLTYFILAVELALNVFIVSRVKYTEIDWIAYMQECEGFLNGTLDYAQLKG